MRLSAGDLVPADLRLLESRDLFVTQAALTGEAMPVEKYEPERRLRRPAAAVPAGPPPEPLDSPHLLFRGTSVVSGTGQAIVLATGSRTCFGGMAARSSSSGTSTCTVPTAAASSSTPTSTACSRPA